MSPSARRTPDRRSRPRRRLGRAGAWALRLAVAALAFAVGVAFGRALEDDPDPRQRRTYVRTLKPRPVLPAAQTVTRTVTVREE